MGYFINVNAGLNVYEDHRHSTGEDRTERHTDDRPWYIRHNMTMARIVGELCSVGPDFPLGCAEHRDRSRHDAIQFLKLANHEAKPS
jgi:hypothetical protein